MKGKQDNGKVEGRLREIKEGELTVPHHNHTPSE